MLSPELSENIKQRLKRADEAIHEYEAQQQIIWILIERLGGSVTIGLESLVTRRLGTILIHRDEETGATTISLKRDEAVAA
jgi:hypothetical protein